MSNILKKNTKKIIMDTGKGVKAYIKGQLSLLSITYLILALGLDYLDISHAYLIAVGISLLDLIPIVGISIIILPWALVNYFLENTALATGLAILLVSTIIIKQVLEPIIIGKSIGIKPVYTLVITVIGSLLLGPIGIILGPVIAIFIKAVYEVISKNR